MLIITPKIIGITKPDKPSMIALLLSLGLWDRMGIEERRCACERGEIWDTEVGREFMSFVKRSG